MKKTDVVDLLDSVSRVRAAFSKVKVNHDAEVSLVMRRLVMEACINYMSPAEIAQASGYTEKAVRLLLRNEGLDPRMKKPMLSKHAARVLSDNAALLGLEPADLLLSPLAYLPAGDSLRREVQDRAVSKVTDIPEDNSDLRTAIILLRKMMFLRQYGENAPGHTPGENWRTLETEVEEFTRGVVRA